MSERGELVRELVSHLRPLVLNSARVVETGVRHLGWTVAGRAVVAVLAQDGPTTVPGIGRRLDLPRQAVQRQVDELMALGHAQTQANPEHRRSVLVLLTRAGRRAWEDVAAAELDQMRQLASRRSERDLRTAVAVLQDLDDDLRDLVRAQGGLGGGRLSRHEQSRGEESAG